MRQHVSAISTVHLVMRRLCEKRRRRLVRGLSADVRGCPREKQTYVDLSAEVKDRKKKRCCCPRRVGMLSFSCPRTVPVKVTFDLVFCIPREQRIRSLLFCFVRAGESDSILRLLVMALSKPYSCRICGLDFEEQDGRLHGPTFRCKTCESSLRQIRRNVDKPDLENFSDQEQKEFFRKLQSEKAKSQGWPSSVDGYQGVTCYSNDHTKCPRLQG